MLDLRDIFSSGMILSFVDFEPNNKAKVGYPIWKHGIPKSNHNVYGPSSPYTWDPHN